MLCDFTFRGMRYVLEAGALVTAGRDGALWYHRAADSIERYAEAQQLTPQYVADVLSILSPRVSVEYSVTLAKRYFETGYADGAMKQRQKALETYERTGVFNGPKVNAFSHALRRDESAIVIDAWMYRGLGNGCKPSKPAYRALCDKVRDLATMVDLPPAQCQAAFWTGIRRAVGFTAEGSLEL